MAQLRRFGLAVDDSLLAEFDAFIQRNHYSNRSEALRDLMRKALVEEEWTQGGTIAGGIAYVYDHHRRQLVNHLLTIQHDYHDLILSSQHIHLDHDTCLEIVAVKGDAERVSGLYHQIQALKGIKHIDLIRSTIAQRL